MSHAKCQVCAIKAACGSADACFYAPTPALCARLASVLTDHCIPFLLRGQMFMLHSAADRKAVTELLRNELSAPEAGELRVTFDLANLMGATSFAHFERRAGTQWFSDALLNDLFSYWYQPIVDVERRRIFGHECLIRLDAARHYGGAEILEAAVSRGEVHAFDSYARSTAIRQAARQRKEGRLFINFLPSSIYDPAFCMASTLEAIGQTHFVPADIVFEIVESERVTDLKHLQKIVDYYRGQGFSISMDDVGAGARSLQMMTQIQPDFIKLDQSLTWNSDTTAGLAMLWKTADNAVESGIQPIAKGIETPAMRDAMLACGITLMQGYFFGKPAPAMHPAIPAAAFPGLVAA